MSCVSSVIVVDAVVIRYSTPPGKYSVSKVGVHNHRPTTDVKLAGCQVRRVSRSANHSEAVVPPTYVLVCHAQVNRAPAGFPLRQGLCYAFHHGSGSIAPGALIRRHLYLVKKLRS